MSVEATQLGPREEPELRGFLAQRPFDNVFLEWLLATDSSVATRERFYLCRESSGRLCGAAYFGRQQVLSAQDQRSALALADAPHAQADSHAIVGPRQAVDTFWGSVRRRRSAPRLVRESQPVFALAPSDRRHIAANGLQIRRAQAGDTDAVTRNSAEMIKQELGNDPRSRLLEFDANVRQMIDRGLWWLGALDERPVFFCHLGPHCGQTAQLQGVWTVPSARRRGIGTAALSQICGVLLEEFPSLCLYVNGFNHAAIGLYQRVGFTRAGEFASYLF